MWAEPARGVRPGRPDPPRAAALAEVRHDVLGCGPSWASCAPRTRSCAWPVSCSPSRGGARSTQGRAAERNRRWSRGTGCGRRRPGCCARRTGCWPGGSRSWNAGPGRTRGTRIGHVERGLRKPAPRSRRGRTDRLSGGQPGHEGTTLDQVETPDEVVTHARRAGAGAAAGWGTRRWPPPSAVRSSTCRRSRVGGRATRGDWVCGCGRVTMAEGRPGWRHRRRPAAGAGGGHLPARRPAPAAGPHRRAAR